MGTRACARGHALARGGTLARGHGDMGRGSVSGGRWRPQVAGGGNFEQEARWLG